MKDYMIVMQYANKGSLLSYLDQNINNLKWRMKLQHLYDIALDLSYIHRMGLVHCNLHGNNIVMHDYGPGTGVRSFICDFCCSQSVNSHPTIHIQGSLPFTAPEVFHTYKFTQKSDIYSFGIIMYLMATGDQPFRDRGFDKSLICDIVGGLRPIMPDSAPEEYKKLAEQCCDADPDKHPDAWGICDHISKVRNTNTITDDNSKIWYTIYHSNSNVRP